MDALEFTYHTKITSKCFLLLHADKPSFGDGTTSASFFYGTGTLIPGSDNVTTAAPFRCVGHNTVRCEKILLPWDLSYHGILYLLSIRLSSG